MFVAISILPRILSGPLAAMLQSWLGWVGLYQVSFVLALGFIPFLVMIQKQTMDCDVDIISESASVTKATTSEFTFMKDELK